MEMLAAWRGGNLGSACAASSEFWHKVGTEVRESRVMRELPRYPQQGRADRALSNGMSLLVLMTDLVVFRW